MSYDLSFLVGSRAVSRDEVRAHFAGRRNYAVSDGQAAYENPETGVYFTFDLGDAAPPYAPVTLNVNYFRPPGFGLEAEIETRALVQAFDLAVDDPQVGGMGRGPYSPEGFLRGWNSGNRVAHDVLVRKEEAKALFALDAWTLEHAWRWNHQRKRYQEWLGEEAMKPGFVPKIVVVEHPSRGRLVSTAVIWSETMAIALPRVDLVIVVGQRPDGGPDVRHVPWDALEPLLEGFERGSPSAGFRRGGATYEVGMWHHLLDYEAPPPALVAGIAERAQAGGPRVVPWDRVVVEELVSAAVVIPTLRAVASGAEPPPPDLAMSLYTTSVHRTQLSTLRGTGEVVREWVHDDTIEPLGTVPLDEVRALAKVVVDSGYPSFPPQPPPGDPMASIHVPPVSIGVRVAGHGLFVQMQQASEIPPAFDAIRAQIDGVLFRLSQTPAAREGKTREDAAREAASRSVEDRLQGELEAAARGEKLLEISALFVPERELEISVTVHRTVHRIEKRKKDHTVVELGEPSTEDRQAIARAVLAAWSKDGFPHLAFPRTWPRAGLSVHFDGGAARQVLGTVEDFDANPALSAARNAIYALARRFTGSTSGAPPPPASVAPPRPASVAPPPPVAPPAASPAHAPLAADVALAMGLFLANHTNQVSDMEILHTDGTISSGWYASRVQLGEHVAITLSHHPSAPGPARQDVALDPSRVAGVRVWVGNAPTVFGEAPPARTAPSVPPARPALSPYPPLMELANHRTTTAAVLRALAEHRGLWVLGVPLPSGGHVPRTFHVDGREVLPVFTSEASFDAFVARWGAPPIAIRDNHGSALFGRMPPSIATVHVDPEVAMSLAIKESELGALRAVAQAVAVERLLERPDDPAFGATLRGYDGFRVPLVRAADGSHRLLIVQGPAGEPLAAVLTAEDCVAPLLATRPDVAAQVSVTTMNGVTLFGQLPGYRVPGIAWNPAGPGARVAMPIVVCSRVMAS